MNCASGLQPLIFTVNDALADAFTARSPSTAGVLPVVTLGVHEGPAVCVSVKPFSVVAYAGPTLPFVAVMVMVRVFPVPDFCVAENFSP